MTSGDSEDVNSVTDSCAGAPGIGVNGLQFHVIVLDFYFCAFAKEINI